VAAFPLGIAFQMPNNIFDIYTDGAILFLFLAILNFKRGNRRHSQGKKLLGLSSLLLSITLVLLKFNIAFYQLVLIIAFIVGVIAQGILMTTERKLNENYRRRVRDQTVTETGQEKASQKKSQQQVILAGSLVILLGIIIWIWRNQVVFPLFLIISGCFYIIMSQYHGRQIAKRDQPPKR
jgi:hypothetical protein